ncbi:hypothetical protein BDN70DRAFT_898961 [Pholiota conissans]|uniref:Uncharacterized protein n=1 Tax=Pholiota conissans TaxID=109636 RepID=A0A9P5YRC4_9AGAR|nr:hypothetical protein BDN70DRAFT_898961 [Pholiota conissans]
MSEGSGSHLPRKKLKRSPSDEEVAAHAAVASGSFASRLAVSSAQIALAGVQALAQDFASTKAALDAERARTAELEKQVESWKVVAKVWKLRLALIKELVDTLVVQSDSEMPGEQADAEAPGEQARLGDDEQDG